MQYITLDDLTKIGITKSPEEADALLAHLNEQLEERVGTEIVESLEDEKLDEYLTLEETGTDEEVGKWLLENVPELPQMVQDEIDILLGELAENADGINTAS